MLMPFLKYVFYSSVMLCLLMVNVCAADKDPYSPYVNQDYPGNVYWGDTHLHSSYSIDANNMTNENISPEHAYKFARGEEVIAQKGLPVKLGRPLDFLVIADHGEYLGLMAKLDGNDPELMKSSLFRRWLALRKEGKQSEVIAEYVKFIKGDLSDDARLDKFTRSVWKEYANIADKYYQPGIFTTFIAYEWTSIPNGANLHRNVIFLDDAAKATKILPFSATDSFKPEDLWRFLEDYERTTGGQVLAIPHNPNVSGGLMFSPNDSEGRPFTKEYASTRSRWEPLLEVTQVKGDSESHEYLSPEDEFADFGDWDWGNMLGSKTHPEEWFQYEYARPALKLGLKVEAEVGANPFKFGLVGSTDIHTGLSTTDENNFWGKISLHEPSPERATDLWLGKQFAESVEGSQTIPAWAYLASGYAAVWAEDNTREALFEAMQRREVYATTGTRIAVRFFGGWRFEDSDALKPDFARIGYKKGVPMGGDLTAAPANQATRFLIHVAKDPHGANLDRVQIIKGWLGSGGRLHERVYDVAVSGDRTINAEGRAYEEVGTTVDIENATYTNSIGAVELAAVWTDPDFSASERAFYYVRVLEIPTPRWTAYDAKFFDLDLPDDVPLTHQERAYTSPIWYKPGN